MNQPSAIHATFVLERSFPTTPSRLFAAFSDPAQKRRWFVEGPAHQVEKHELDFRPGGHETALLRFNPGTPIAGLACATDTIYLDIVPDHRITLANTMALEGRCFSASLVTIEFLPNAGTTDLVVTHQGAFFENSDGPQLREEGWRQILNRLSAEFPA